MASVKLYNMARMTVSGTPGTGTITLGSAVAGRLSFASAGVANADVVRYTIEDGTAREEGYGTYTSSGTTLTRTVESSTNSNSAISLSGTAQVFITPSKSDFPWLVDSGGASITTSKAVTITDSTAGSSGAGALVVSTGGASIGGALYVGGTTASSSTTTGSLVNGGGFGNGGAAWIGGALHVTDATGSTATTTGCGIFAGGIGVAENVRCAKFFAGGDNGRGGACAVTYTAIAVNGLVLDNTATGAGSQLYQIFYRNGTTTGNISGTDTTTTYNTTSDKTLKCDQRPYLDARLTVDETVVYDFAWRSTGRRGVGVFAQDEYGRVPDAIAPPSGTGESYWSADYSKYVPVLIADAQETHRRLTAVETQLAALGT